MTGDPDADGLLVTEPLALLIGMLLDQQVPMEWAFTGPYTLRTRLGGRLDAAEIAAMPLSALESVFTEKPALHRFPGSMAKRTHALCRRLVDEYAGDASAVWSGASDADELFERLVSLPGYGEEKSKIFVALLGKRLGVTPEGWERVAEPFSGSTPRSVADIDSPEALVRVRAWKRAQKAKGKGKGD